MAEEEFLCTAGEDGTEIQLRDEKQVPDTCIGALWGSGGILL